MPGIHDTAYPRFKKRINLKELEQIYTPSKEEMVFARKEMRGEAATLCFLSLLKTFQRLGYFVRLKQIPDKIIRHIAGHLGCDPLPDLSYYDLSRTRVRHLARIRSYLNITAYDQDSIAIVESAVKEACQVKEDLADIINVAIEELVHHRHELPAFSNLRRLAYNGRAKVNAQIYQQITANLTRMDRARLNRLFIVDKNRIQSPWQMVKIDAGKLTLKNFKQRIEYVQWLDRYDTGTSALARIADVKIKQFSAEAKSLKAPQMKRLKAAKRYALAVTLIAVQKAKALDDLGEMLIKRVNKTHKKGRNALTIRIEKNQDRTDNLVDTLHQILLVHRDNDQSAERDNAINEIIGDKKDRMIKECEEHALYAGKNYFPFLWRYHTPHRTALFDVISSTPLVSTTQDNTLIQAVEFVKYHRRSKKRLIDLANTDQKVSLPSMAWISERWQTAVFGCILKQGPPESVHRQYLELCVFYYLMLGLKSGDICISGSDQFSDYRTQLVKWSEYYELIGQYGVQVGLPIEGPIFVNHARTWLHGLARKADDSFPDNQCIYIDQGKPIIRKINKGAKVQGLERFEAAVAKRFEPVTILDVLNFTRRWLAWDKCFGPLSGFDSKLDSPDKHYIVTTFCYGCNLGPIQTARSIKDFSRYQIAWANQRHVTEEKLNQAIVEIINAYDRFDLPKIWGSGKSASVDGTMWDVYEANLFSEYHIRYGGYGGIGYYHVSDQYIALFSHFIPCGVHEAIYILDGLLKNESNIQPDTIHGDTHAQSETVFGLSYLLGIKLMPRIRNWKHLTLYKPDKKMIFKHIEELFSDKIDWELIEKYLPDMLRVALSIKMGRITASSILRKLGTYSRKNKLYQAFRELGRVVRTAFLLEYLNDKELREIIQAATCKSETFNKFAQWLLFGGEGIISENNRDEQRKIIKYNHLVANCLSLYNVVSLTKIINELIAEGYPVTQEMAASISPYMTAHVNRFGDYHTDFDGKVPDLIFKIHLPEFVN